MLKALKEAQDSDKSQFEKMNSIDKVYNSNRKCSVQEAVYLTMPELWYGLENVFQLFNLLIQIDMTKDTEYANLLKKEELPDDSDDLFKRNMLDRYIDRPNATFKGEKFL